MIKRRTTLNIADNSGALTVQVQRCAQPVLFTKRIAGSVPLSFELRSGSLSTENQSQAQPSLTYSEFIEFDKVERFEPRSISNRSSNDRCSQSFPFQLNYGNRLQ